MIDTGRVAALLTLIQRLPAEERQMIADQLQAIQRARAAGFTDVPQAGHHLLPSVVEVQASLEEGRRVGGDRRVRDGAGLIHVEYVSLP